MRQKLFSVVSVLICLTFLAGSTGINFFVHTCNSSHVTDVTPFPEFQQKGTSCCCSEESSAFTSDTGQTGYSDPGCCKNTFKFVKANLTAFPVIGKVVAYPVIQNVATDLPVRIHNTQKILPEYISWQDHSPPLSGKALVFFIHQIRIPSPVC